MYDLPCDLGPYRLLEELGRGALSVVYEAEALADRDAPCGGVIAKGRIVAVKVLRPEHARDPGSRDRFAREMRNLSHLDHPNVIRILDVGEESGAPYFVQTRMAGGSMARVIDGWKETSSEFTPDDAETVARSDLTESPALDDSRVRWITNRMYEAASGLAYLHERGVVHRDVKPGNLLLAADCVCRLGDFGLARGTEDQTLTIESDLLGTPAYMAPEVVSRRTPPTKQSDVWSFGASFYEALSLRPPISRAQGRDVLSGRSGPRPQPLESIVKQVPHGLSVLIDRCLEEHPRLRFQDGRSLLDAVEAWRSSRTVPAGPALLTRGAVWLDRHRRATSAAAFVLLLVALTLATWSAGTAGDAVRAASSRLAMWFDPYAPDPTDWLRRLDAGPGDGSQQASLERAIVLLHAGRRREASSAVVKLRERGFDGPAIEVLAATLAGRSPPRAEPRSVHEAILLALVGLSTGDLDRAVAILDGWPEGEEAVAPFLRTRMLAFAQNARWEEALRDAKTFVGLPAVDVDPTVLLTIADVTMRLDDRAAARRALQDLEPVLRPDDPRRRLRHARFLLRFRDDSDWKRRVMEFLEQRVPGNGGGHDAVRLQLAVFRLRALLAENDDQRRGLVHAAELSVRQNPKQLDLRLAVARLQLDLGRMDAVADTLDGAVTFATTSQHRYEIAQLRAELAWRTFEMECDPERLAGVLRYAAQAQAVRPEDVTSRLLEARARHARGLLDGASGQSGPQLAGVLASVETILASEPGYLPARRFKGQVLARSPGDAPLAEGVRILREIRRAGLSAPEDLLHLARAYGRREQWTRQRDCAVSGLEQMEDEPWRVSLAMRGRLRAELLAVRARAELELGDLARARAAALLSSEIEPDLPYSWYILYRIVDSHLTAPTTRTDWRELRNELVTCADVLERIGTGRTPASQANPHSREEAGRLFDRLRDECGLDPAQIVWRRR